MTYSHLKMLLIFILLIVSSIHSSSIEVGGIISEDTEWKKSEADTFKVIDTTTILSDMTLTIDPGLVIEFQGYHKLSVLGRLLAAGNENDSILFTAVDTVEGWNGIRFDTLLSDNDSSIISFCRIEYGKAMGNDIEGTGGGIYINTAYKIRISNCHITKNVSKLGGSAIVCFMSSPLITDNLIDNNCFADTKLAKGAGIWCVKNANPIISNNKIVNNYANDGFGGGITCTDTCSPEIINNIISDNFGEDAGGIGCTSGSDPLIMNNTITYNISFSGGGITCYMGSSPRIINNVISNNICTTIRGGGISCRVDASPLIEDNTITDNSVQGLGGGIDCVTNSSPVIRNNIIKNNRALDGGGIACSDYSDPIIVNNCITNNVAERCFAGGICCADFSNPLIINNTICFNTADSAGGGIYCWMDCSPTITNSIIWGNSTDLFGDQVYLNDTTCDPSFYYCDVEDGKQDFEGSGADDKYEGEYEHNIDRYPEFNDTSTQDFSLKNNSPCINKGNPDTTGLSISEKDLAGNQRIVGHVVDIGAYENQEVISILANTSLNAANNVALKVVHNPLNNSIRFLLNFAPNTNANIRVYNFLGKVVFERNGIVLSQKKQDSFIEWDVGNLAKGHYLAVLRGNEKNRSNMYVQKFRL